MSAKAKWTRVGTIGWIVGMAFTGVASAQAPPALLPEPESLRIDKNKFVSFSFPDAPEGTQWAVRVTLVKMYNTDPADTENEACPVRGTGCGPAGTCNLDAFTKCNFDSDCPPPLSTFAGQVRWVGSPQVLEGTAFTFKFIGAPLGCCPEFREWAAELDPMWEEQGCFGFQDGHCLFGVNSCVDISDCAQNPIVHLYGTEILPCSQYLVQLVDIGCADLQDEACYSEGLILHTAQLGDVTPPSGGPYQPNFTDIGFLVKLFRTIPSGQKIQAMLRGNVAQVTDLISFVDIGGAVQGYKAIRYRQVGPTPCTDPCE